MKANAKRNGEELDLNKYFEVFDSLSLKPETALDWVYSFTDLDGTPLLYSRDKAQKPFATSAELVEAVREEAELDHVDAIRLDYSVRSMKLSDEFGDDPFSYNKEAKDARGKLEKDLDRRLAQHPHREYWHWWREGVIADGSAQSYLELTALFLLAD